MKLTQLRYYCEVCRQNGVTRAAEALRVSQPSVSQAIRELEEEFGLALFRREGRGLVPTEDGLKFFHQALGVLNHADRFEQSMLDLSDREVIRLGVPPMIGSLLLPSLYALYRPFAEQYRLEIVEEGRNFLLNALNNRQIDLAFLPHDTPLSRFAAIPIGEMETVCCAAAARSIQRAPALRVETLKDTPLVLFSDSFFQTTRVLERFRAAGVRPNILMQSSQLSTIQRMIAANVAVGFLFSGLIDAVQDVVAVPLSPAMRVSVSLVWNQSEPLTKGRRAFLRLIPQLHLA